MKRVTTGISSGLSYVMLAAQAFAAIGGVIGAACLAVAIISPATLAKGITPRSASGAALDLTVPGALVFTFLLLTLAMLAVFAIATQLRALLASLGRGTPFVPDNVRRLHIVAGVLGAMVVFEVVAPFLAGDAIRRAMEIGPVSIDFGALIGALVVLVLAEVFREGVVLREEAEGTI